MLTVQSLPPLLGRIAIAIRNLILAALAVAGGLGLGLALTSDQTLPITIIGLAAYALLIVTRPLAGLAVWIVTAPFSRFWYLDIVLGRGIPDLTLTRLCAGLLLVVVLAQVAVGSRRGRRPLALDGLILATLIGIGAALPAALQGLKGAVTNYSDAYLVPAIVYALARLLVRERRQAESIATAFIIMGVILSAVALEEQFASRPLFWFSERSWVYTKDIHKLTGLLGSPAFFATLMTMSSGFAIYRFVQERRALWSAFYLALAAFMIVGVFYTYNRAGWLSLAVCLTLMALFWPRFRWVFAVVLLVGGLAVSASWATVQRSAVVTQRLNARGPIDYRIEIWGRATRILAQNPIAGLGYGNFGRVYLRYNPAWETATVMPAPHNSALEVVFNTGLVGAIPYLAMLAAMLVGTARFYRRARDSVDGEAGLVLAFGLAIVAYLIQAMVVDMVAAHYVNMVFMLAVGALFGWQSKE